LRREGSRTEAALVDLGSAAQQWQTHGFVILPGFVPAAELKPALDELPALYPTAEGFHDGTDGRRDRFTADEWAGIDSFPFRSAELSLLAVSGRVVDLAQTLLADTDLRISSAEAWAKYTSPNSEDPTLLTHTPPGTWARTARNVSAAEQDRTDTKSQVRRVEMAAGDTQITIAGNLVDDPELRFTPAGQPVARFRVASTPRFRDNNTGEWKDGDSLFLTCNVWRQAAENVAESLTRGTRVIVSGRLRQRSYETKEGEKRTVYEVEVDDVGPSLRNASAKVNKVARNGAGAGTGGSGGSGGRPAGGQGGQAPGGGGDTDPWASDGAYTDEPPF
jgi:single-strand DNA-binding protein